MSFYNIVGTFGGRPTISTLLDGGPYYNYNICDHLGDAYIPGLTDIEITISSGVVVGSVSPSIPAFKVGACLFPGDTVTIINNGEIIGAGGPGGSSAYDADGSPGVDGGTAVELDFATTIDNNGLIAGGGGGGGATNGGHTYPGCLGIGPVSRWTGDGGGGGAGFNPGSGGYGNASGSNGTKYVGGAGGSSDSTAVRTWQSAGQATFFPQQSINELNSPRTNFSGWYTRGTDSGETGKGPHTYTIAGDTYTYNPYEYWVVLNGQLVYHSVMTSVDVNSQTTVVTNAVPPDTTLYAPGTFRGSVPVDLSGTITPNPNPEREYTYLTVFDLSYSTLSSGGAGNGGNLGQTGQGPAQPGGIAGYYIQGGQQFATWKNLGVRIGRLG